MNRKQIVISPHRNRQKNFSLGAMALAVTASLALGISSVGAVTPGKDAKVKLNDACTFISVRDVGRQFGKPVTVVPGAGILGKYGCIATVGSDSAVAPGGIFYVEQVFPYAFSNRPDAGAALEDDRAYDASAGDDIKDVDGLGKAAYLDRTSRRLVVQATNKLVFSLRWDGAGTTKITAAVQKRLIKVARGIVTRSP